MSVSDFAVALVEYCESTGGSVTSWKRSVSHNRAVGGVSDSRHLSGLGADVVYDTPIPLVLRLDLARKRGLQLIREVDHDHLQAPR